MVDLIIRLFEPMFGWTGRIDRKTFCGSALLAGLIVYGLAAVVAIPLTAIGSGIGIASFSLAFGSIYLPVAWALTILILGALVTQRAHDLGHSSGPFGVTFLVSFAAERLLEALAPQVTTTAAQWQDFAGMLIVLPAVLAMFILVLASGRKCANKYGPAPKPAW